MVVGNGLLANSLCQFRDDDSVIIFASGVSNSLERDKSAFQREEHLITQFVGTNKLFVYFSTCSVYDTSLSESMYIIHKLQMERLIQDNFANFLIIRLPNVVGKCSNPHTLMNYFYHQIQSVNLIRVQKNATRYLVHTDEVKSLVGELLKPGVKFNIIADLVIHERVYILEVIHELENFLNKKARIEISETGQDYSVIPHPIFHSLIAPLKLEKIAALRKLITLTFQTDSSQD